MTAFGGMSRQRFLRLALYFQLLVVVGVVLVLALEVAKELRTLRAEPLDNLNWNLTQLELDLVRLQSEVDLAIALPGRDLAELRKRFDLFYSRGRLLERGSMLTELDLSRSMGPITAEVTAFLGSTAPLMDGPDESLLLALPGLADEARRLRIDLRAALVKLVADFAAQADKRRTALTQLLTQIAVATLAMVAGLAALLVSVIRLNWQAERRRAETSRVSSRLAATVGTSLDGVVVAGSDGRIIDFNAAAEGIFGFARDEAVGADMADLILPPQHTKAHRAGMVRIAAGGRKHVVDAGRIQITAVRKSREEFPVELSIAENKGPDGTIYIAYIRDISDRLAAERALTTARDEALAAEKAKTNFMAVVSHEMRTPLNGVMAALEIASRTPADDRQALFLGIARASAEQLMQHVNGVLDISKIEAGQMVISADDVDLGALVAGICDTMRPVAEERGNTLHLRQLAPVPMVYGDGFRIRQVLDNFLSNAIKFTSDGSATVELEPQDETEHSLVAEIRVTDTGIGISEADLGRVFEDFVMLDPSYGREAGGTGLGLAIARRLTEAMGGTIGVESELGEGSCFWIRLPMKKRAGAHRSVDAAPALPASEPGTGSAAEPSGLDVLVVEDNATNRIVLKELLGMLGHRVTLAVDGSEGVRRARAHRHDVILMDISMPVLDGIAATQLIRQSGKSFRSRIIAVTAHTLPEELQRFRDAGMDGCLTKPISSADLAAALAGISAAAADAAAPEMPDATPEGRMHEVPLTDAGRLADLRAAIGDDGLARALDRLALDAPAKIAALLAAGAATPPDRAAALALSHELAGAAGTLGAARLHARMAAAEHALRSDDLPGFGSAITGLPDLWQDTEAALAAALATPA
jgi:PAS domain S-box-containing protein